MPHTHSTPQGPTRPQPHTQRPQPTQQASALLAREEPTARGTPPCARRSARSGVAAWVCAVAVGAATGSAWAQPANGLDQVARDWLDQALTGQTPTSPTGPLRPEIVIGHLDPRLQLAPCARVEPYLPHNTQLWGRTRVGLKCLEGPVAWNVFLPITIKAWGPAWVMRQTVQTNAVLSAGDAELVPEVDWADARSPIVALQEDWVGMQAAFTLLPGQALRQNAVRPPQVFSVGTQVRVTANGVGFEMSATAQALSSGYVGQPARVKLSNGKMISGQVSADGSVQVNL